MSERPGAPATPLRKGERRLGRETFPPAAASDLELSKVAACEISNAHITYLESSCWPWRDDNESAWQLWKHIRHNHESNRQLWNEENLARRTDVPDSVIVTNKRTIDCCNRSRTDAIEHIDEWILGQLAGIEPLADAWFNSETAGSIIDRLSILSLKVFYHQHALGEMTSAAEHTAAAQRVSALRAQRDDLIVALDLLLHACICGKAFYKMYRQYKMYGTQEAPAR